ncbi:YncE family protein, partial [Streptomyces sp. NPDC001356]
MLMQPSAAASTEPPPSPRSSVSVTGRPYGVAISPDGGHAYVTSGWLGRLLVFDTHTKQRTSHVQTGESQDVAVSPDGRRAYVTSPSTVFPMVSVIDTATNREVGHIPVGHGPFGLAVAPDGRRVYVANAYSDSLSVIDTASGKVVDEIKVGSDPVDVVVSPDGRRVYVANSGYGTPTSVSVIDTTTDKVVGRPGRLGNFTYGLAVTPD